MKVAAVVLVRMGSSRLPGKPLKLLAGREVLGRLIDRLNLCHRLDTIVVATSDLPQDDAIEEFCQSESVSCYRGDEHDVLGRMAGALHAYKAEVGVTIFGDCPLIDPAIVDELIVRYQTSQMDFVGNDLKTSYPPGMEVEVFSLTAITLASQSETDPAIREHGTLHIRQNLQGTFKVLNVEAPLPLRRPELELELDTAEDLSVLEQIVAHFTPRSDYTLAELISFMDAHPEIARTNQDVHRVWKQFRDE